MGFNVIEGSGSESPEPPKGRAGLGKSPPPPPTPESVQYTVNEGVYPTWPWHKVRDWFSMLLEEAGLKRK